MIKRALDIAVGTVLALMVTPLVAVLALSLAVQFRAWPFFVQERTGMGGRAFRIVKLRTLPLETPAYADKYELRGVSRPALPDLLRRLHLDELPQLWLVPLGRMSLVGPRPEMSFLPARIPEPVARKRVSMRPGCTGLWQVSRDASGLIHEHPEYDLAYLDHASLRFDLWILWQTVLVFLGSPRRITLADVPSWVGMPDRAATRETLLTAA